MKKSTQSIVLILFLFSLSKFSSAQSDCSNPEIITNLPFLQNGLTTDGAGDNYSVSPCDDNYISGDDYVFTYTTTGAEYVSIELSNVGAWTGLHLLDACPDVATTCTASDINSLPGTRLIENVYLEGGTTYFIIVSTFAAPQSTNFDINVRPGVPPPAGTDCSNPYEITDLPFEDLAQSTEDFGDLYSGTGPCLSEDYLNGNEIIYRYIPNANEDVSIKVSNISGFFTSIQVMDACINDSPSCVASDFNQVTTDDLVLDHLNLEKGAEYYIVISTWENPQSTDFDFLMIAERSCPDVENIVVSNITHESAEVHWSSDAPNWNIKVLDAGASPSGIPELVFENTYAIDGLQDDKVYDVYIQANCPSASLMITGVYDGPLSGGNPKGVELFVVEDINDLSEYSIGSANNGEGSDGAEFTFPAIAVSKGTHLHFTSNMTLFQSFFGFAADFEDPSALINGNDAVELFFDNQVIDVFGDINVDGTDQVWEYKDGWAYRKNGHINNSGIFDPTRWNFSGIDVLEGGPTNEVCDVPMTISTFVGPFELSSQWVGPVPFYTLPAPPVCNGRFLDNGGASRPYTSTSGESYTICPEIAGYSVSVKFDLFDLQADGMQCIDELYIYDGEDTNAPPISAPNGTSGAWCWEVQNSEGSGNLLNQTITANNSSGCLTFVFNADDNGAHAGWEATVSCAAEEDCPGPQDLAVSDITPVSAKANWRSVAAQSQTTSIVWGVQGFDPFSAIPITATGTEYEITGLSANTTYEFYVMDDCQAFGESAWEGPVSFTTTESCPGPQNLQAIEVTAVSAKAVWQSIASESETTFLVWGTQGFDPDNATPISVSGGEYMISGLTQSTTYEFYIREDCQAFGESNWVGPVDFFTTENCPGPQNLTVTDITASTAKASWESIASESEGTYLVWGPVGIDPNTETPVLALNNEYDFIGLTSSTYYEFYIKEDCQSFGESSWIGPERFFTSCSSDVGDNMQNAIEVPFLPYSAVGSTADCFSDDMGNTAADAFYAYVAGDCIQSIAISTCSEITDFDTYLIVLDEMGNQIASNDDAEEGECSEAIDGLNRLSQLELNVEPGMKYFIIVEGFGPNEGVYELSIDEAAIQPMAAMAFSEEVSCFGEQDGRLEIEVIGGVEPYEFNWSNGSSDPIIEMIDAGTYTLTITDNCGVEFVEMYEVPGPEEMLFNSTIENTSELNSFDGSIMLEVTGGLSPYRYEWSNGEVTRNIANLEAGEYCITITDSNGCAMTDCFVVETGIVSSVEQIDLIAKLAIQPNPVSDQALINVEFRKEVALTIDIVDMTGRIIHSFDREQAQSRQYQLDVSEYPDGIYFVQIGYDNYIFSYKLVVAR